MVNMNFDDEVAAIRAQRGKEEQDRAQKEEADRAAQAAEAARIWPAVRELARWAADRLNRAKAPTVEISREVDVVRTIFSGKSIRKTRYQVVGRGWLVHDAMHSAPSRHPDASHDSFTVYTYITTDGSVVISNSANRSTTVVDDRDLSAFAREWSGGWERLKDLVVQLVEAKT